MAKPIAQTPELTGEDAIFFLKKMNAPPRKKMIKFGEEIRSQRNAPF